MKGDADQRQRLAMVWLAGTSLLATGVVTSAFLLWRDRLPDPLASHFGPSGEADGFVSPGAWLGVAVALLLGTGLFFLVFARFFPQRAAIAAGAGVNTMLGTILVSNLTANTGLADAADAVLSPWWVAFALALGALVAVPVLRMLGPDPVPDRPARETAALAVGEGEAVSWHRTFGSRGMTWVALFALSVGLVMASFGEWIGAAGVLFAGLLTIALSWYRVAVDRRGLTVRPAALPWPYKRIALDRMAGAATIDVNAVTDFGGYGYRIRSGGSGVITRSGPGLVVRQADGRDFTVTVQDPETAAGLLTGLLERRRGGGE